MLEGLMTAHLLMASSMCFSSFCRCLRGYFHINRRHGTYQCGYNYSDCGVVGHFFERLLAKT